VGRRDIDDFVEDTTEGDDVAGFYARDRWALVLGGETFRTKIARQANPGVVPLTKIAAAVAEVFSEPSSSEPSSPSGWLQCQFALDTLGRRPLGYRRFVDSRSLVISS